jgi:AcrR family transcriptional regulator
MSMADRATPRAPRADAQRNVAAILAAAQDCLAEDPDATMSRIAEVAGVGRVTLYGHFRARAELVDAVFRTVTEQSNAILARVDTGGEPVAALVRLIRASWQVVHRFRSVLAAAEAELPAHRIREHHDEHLARVTQLIRRGQRSGALRTDLPASWLVTVAYSLMHAAADECTAGKQTAAEGEQAVVATLLAALTPPGRTVPAVPEPTT